MSTSVATWNVPGLADRELAADRDYWLQRLGGVPASYIPLDGQREDDHAPVWRTHAVPLEPPAVDRLQRVTGGNDTRAFVVLLAALNILLRRYTRSDDVIVGSTIHRAHADVGALNRIVALRNEVDGRMTVRTFVTNVQASLQAAYAHQKYPFRNVLKLIGLDAPDRRSPLFNVAIVLDGIHALEDLSGAGVDVTLQWRLDGANASCAVHYDAGTLWPATVQAFAAQYVHVVASVLSTPDAMVAALPCVTDAEIRRLVVGFNDTTDGTPREDRPVHVLFETQSAGAPDAIAVARGEACVSYGELDTRANILAGYLRRLDDGPGQRIGVCVDHGPEMLVALLGILKAGCAYMPIDPDCPPLRVAFMLRHAAIATVITQAALAGRFDESGIRTVCVDDEWPAIARHGIGEPPVVEAARTAYVLYTSGSTGEPKGVEIQHAALTNYVTWARRAYVGEQTLTFALYSSLGFDLTVTSIFVPLVSGNRIETYTNNGPVPPLLAILEEDRVDAIKLTPSHLALIRDQDLGRSRVRTLIIGGESLDRELAAQIWSGFGARARLFNEYGPTEATVGCMIHAFDPRRDLRASVPIGFPGANTQIYVLDDDRQPLGLNQVGQLCISGDGLARGYLESEALTAASFVDNPWLPGRRMYLTGDLARHLPEGGIGLRGTARRSDQGARHAHPSERDPAHAQPAPGD